LLRVGGLAACLLLSLGRDGDLELGGERGAVRVGGLAALEHFPAIALRLLGKDAVLVAGGLVSGAYILGHEGSSDAVGVNDGQDAARVGIAVGTGSDLAPGH